jgi:hypothetical protein
VISQSLSRSGESPSGAAWCMDNTKLTIKDCRKFLGDETLTDEKVEEIRDALYSLVESVFDKNDFE